MKYGGIFIIHSSLLYQLFFKIPFSYILSSNGAHVWKIIVSSWYETKLMLKTGGDSFLRKDAFVTTVCGTGGASSSYLNE